MRKSTTFQWHYDEVVGMARSVRTVLGIASVMSLAVIACSSGTSSPSPTTGAQTGGSGGADVKGAGGAAGQSSGGQGGAAIACHGVAFFGLCNALPNCGQIGDPCGTSMCAGGSSCWTDLVCRCPDASRPYSCLEMDTPHKGRYPACDGTLKTCVGYAYGCAPDGAEVACDQSVAGYAGFCTCNDLGETPVMAEFGCDTDPSATCDSLCAQVAGK